jgi:hypothetical protein
VHLQKVISELESLGIAVVSVDSLIVRFLGTQFAQTRYYVEADKPRRITS